MIQEIEQIKAAEHGAIQRIEAAKKQADQLIQKAREDSVMQFENRRIEAESEVKKIRDKSLAKVHTFSTEMSEKAENEVKKLKTEGEKRMPAAVAIIVKRIIGGSDVLSGTDG